MRKMMSGAAGAVLVAAAASPAAAQPQCLWNGAAWVCPPSAGYAQPYSGSTQPAPGYSQSAPGYYDPAWGGDRSGLGYRPRGAGAEFGPDPGGGFRHMGQSNVGHTN